MHNIYQVPKDLELNVRRGVSRCDSVSVCLCVCTHVSVCKQAKMSAGKIPQLRREYAAMQASAWITIISMVNRVCLVLVQTYSSLKSSSPSSPSCQQRKQKPRHEVGTSYTKLYVNGGNAGNAAASRHQIYVQLNGPQTMSLAICGWGAATHTNVTVV